MGPKIWPEMLQMIHKTGDDFRRLIKFTYFHSLWNWSQNWLHVHTFSGLKQLKAPIERASHLDLRHFCGHTPRLVCPDTKTGEGCRLQWPNVLDWIWQDPSSGNTCHRNSTKKNLSRTWQDLDSCMDQSSGPRDDYIGAYFSARVHVFSRMDRMEKTACFQNSEPSELGRVYKQTALLLTVAPTSSLFFLRWAGLWIKWQWFQLVMWISIPLPESQEALFWDCCWQMNWYSQSYVWWKWTMYEWFPLLHLHYHLNHLFPACACYSIMRIYARQDSPYKGHLYHKRPPRWAISSWKHP